jgi:hypothetical protein
MHSEIVDYSIHHEEFQMDDISLLGITDEDVKKYAERRKTKGRRDQRVCVCGHAGNAHFALDGGGAPVDILAAGQVGCQAGRVPCMCNEFKWVLTIPDVRSFIQKTEGPGELHALTKGLTSSAARGYRPVWREGIACFWCKKSPEEVGALIPIAYNERGGEAMRSTTVNRLHCVDCREALLRGDFNAPA